MRSLLIKPRNFVTYMMFEKKFDAQVLQHNSDPPIFADVK